MYGLLTSLIPSGVACFVAITRTLTRRTLSCLVVIWAIYFLAASNSTASTLDVIALGPVAAYGGAPFPIIAINDQGQVAGVTKSGGAPLPFIWQNGIRTDLPNLLGATQVNVTGINNLGQVVGFSNAADGQRYAVTWQNGAIAKLPLEAGYSNSIAYGINDLGQIVGAIGNGSNLQHSVLWSGVSVTDVNLTVGTAAYAVNNAGLVAGGGLLLGGTLSKAGFLWENGNLTDLSQQSIFAGTAVNNQGVMAGFNYYISGGSLNIHAILLQNGVLTDLGTAPGGPYGYATAINDLGQVIGVGDSNGASAFLWENGQMTSLQSLLPAGSPWQLWAVWDINNHNQIVGVASNRVSGATELVLLTVPEPSTISMLLLCGALLLAFRCTKYRRRRQGSPSCNTP